MKLQRIKKRKFTLRIHFTVESKARTCVMGTQVNVFISRSSYCRFYKIRTLFLRKGGNVGLEILLALDGKN